MRGEEAKSFNEAMSKFSTAQKRGKGGCHRKNVARKKLGTSVSGLNEKTTTVGKMSQT